MRTPDAEGSPDDPRSPLGDGFGASADDLTVGFGEDDFSDDAHDSFEDLPGHDPGGDIGEVGDHTLFGDGLGVDAAQSVLVEILDDVLGDDSPDVLEQLQAGYGTEPDELSDTLAGPQTAYAQDELSPDFAALNGLDAPDEPFDDTDLPTKDDFDLTHDGHVDHHDLHEAMHPFDFHGG